MGTIQHSSKIFEYSDYKTYLADYLQYKKKENPAFSIGLWAKKLGLNNTASFSRVITGDRLPGKEIQGRIINYFDFNKKESEFFKYLVTLEKVKGDSELSFLVMEKLSSCHPEKKFKKLDQDTFALISEWHHFAIREMVALPDFVEDEDWIVKRLRFAVTPGKIKKSLGLLQKVGLLSRNESGELIQSNSNFSSDPDVSSEASKRHHEASLELAKNAVRTVGLTLREFDTTVLAINKSKIPEMKELIRKFRNQFIQRFEVDECDEVYSLQIQFFPYTGDGNEKTKIH